MTSTPIVIMKTTTGISSHKIALTVPLKGRFSPLNDMPQPEEDYPIQIHHEEDSPGALYQSYARKLIK